MFWWSLWLSLCWVYGVRSREPPSIRWITGEVIVCFSFLFIKARSAWNLLVVCACCLNLVVLAFHVCVLPKTKTNKHSSRTYSPFPSHHPCEYSVLLHHLWIAYVWTEQYTNLSQIPTRTTIASKYRTVARTHMDARQNTHTHTHTPSQTYHRHPTTHAWQYTVRKRLHVHS